MYYQPLIVNEIPYRTYIGHDRQGGWHWHTEMELILCLQGRMLLELEDRQFSLEAGDALILPGCCAHSGSSQTEDEWRVAIVFGFSLLQNQYADIRDVCLHIPKNADTPLRPTLDTLFDLFRADGAVTDQNEWTIRGNLFLLCQGLRSMPKVNLSQNRQQRLMSIYTALEHVKAHFAERITVEDMATLTGYAKTYFCRQFKQITGCSFYRYLTCYRISVACMLMEDPGCVLSQVASAVGYATQPLFSRAFKEITGMTPSQYRALPPEDKNLYWI